MTITQTTATLLTKEEIYALLDKVWSLNKNEANNRVFYEYTPYLDYQDKEALTTLCERMSSIPENIEEFYDSLWDTWYLDWELDCRDQAWFDIEEILKHDAQYEGLMDSPSFDKSREDIDEILYINLPDPLDYAEVIVQYNIIGDDSCDSPYLEDHTDNIFSSFNFGHNVLSEETLEEYQWELQNETIDAQESFGNWFARDYGVFGFKCLVEKLGLDFSTFLMTWIDIQEEKQSLKNQTDVYTMLVSEINNTPYDYSNVMYAERMLLRDFYELKEKHKRGERIQFQPSSDVFGIYNGINGSGSILELKTDKVLTFEAKEIRIALDGQEGYKIDDVYGLLSSSYDKK